MRYTVTYTKPGQVEGARLFDVADGAQHEAIRKAASETAGEFATIKSIVATGGREVPVS